MYALQYCDIKKKRIKTLMCYRVRCIYTTAPLTWRWLRKQVYGISR